MSVAKAGRFCWIFFKVTCAHKNWQSGFHAALLGSAEWDGVPRETESIFSLCESAGPATGLGQGRDPEGARPGRFPAGRAWRRRDRPGGRRAKTRRRARKPQTIQLYLCNNNIFGFTTIQSDPITAYRSPADVAVEWSAICDMRARRTAAASTSTAVLYS